MSAIGLNAAIGTGHAVGLRFDGTVVSAGRSLAGQDDVKDWTNIIAVATSSSNTAGLSDGTVLVAGDSKKGQKKRKVGGCCISVGRTRLCRTEDGWNSAAVGRITGTEQETNEKVLEIASWRDQADFPNNSYEFCLLSFPSEKQKKLC